MSVAAVERSDIRDDPAQLLQKTLYIRAKGLGGAMMWSLDGDDDNASLTKAVNLGLIS